MSGAAERLRQMGSLGPTTFQWLIERGQPEQQVPTVWLENSSRHPARDRCWTTNAHDAAMFPTRQAAEDYIYEHFTAYTLRQDGPSARAVEHGFMSLKAGQLTQFRLFRVQADALADLIEAAHEVDRVEGALTSKRGEEWLYEASMNLRRKLAAVERVLGGQDAA